MLGFLLRVCALFFFKHFFLNQVVLRNLLFGSVSLHDHLCKEKSDVFLLFLLLLIYYCCYFLQDFSKSFV